MTIEKFVDKYCLEGNKEKFLSERIINKYVSYIDKLVDCERIVESTTYFKEGNDKVYLKNSPMQHVLFVLTLIAQYTDIEINFNDVIYCFDMLDKHDLINKLIKEISPHEYNTYVNLLAMKNDDLNENERSIMSFFEMMM